MGRLAYVIRQPVVAQRADILVGHCSRVSLSSWSRACFSQIAGFRGGFVAYRGCRSLSQAAISNWRPRTRSRGIAGTHRRGTSRMASAVATLSVSRQSGVGGASACPAAAGSWQAPKEQRSETHRITKPARHLGPERHAGKCELFRDWQKRVWCVVWCVVWCAVWCAVCGLCCRWRC